MGEIDLAGVLVFELLQAAARTAVAQAFPFNVGHFLQRLGFPEETLLARRLFGRCGHQSERSMSGSTKYLFGESFSHKLQVGAISGNSILLRVHPGDQKSERDHWFMTPARLQEMASLRERNERLGFAAPSAQDVRTAPCRLLERLRT